MTGVTIRTSYPQNLASGETEKIVTTSKDLTKSLKYTKPGTYHIKASKAGYSDVVKTVTIKQKTTNTTVNHYALKGISFRANLSWDKKKKTIKITPTFYGSKIKYDSYVMCETYNDCVNSNAWNNMEKKYNGITENPTTYRNKATVNKTESVWINTSYNGVANKAYYLRVTTYLSDKSSDWGSISVYKMWVGSNNNLEIQNVYNKYK